MLVKLPITGNPDVIPVQKSHCGRLDFVGQTFPYVRQNEAARAADAAAWVRSAVLAFPFR